MKNRYKKVLAVILSVCMILPISGCRKQEVNSGVSEEEKEDETIEIGMSFDSFVIERWQRDRDVFVSTANELGAEVNVQTANGEVEEQIAQIEYFIDKNVDLIVIVAIDAEALSAVVAKAKKAGIKVMCYDRVIRNADSDLYISFDNEMVGELMARALYSKVGRGRKVITICGPESDYNVAMVGEGFNKVTNDFDVSIIGTEKCEGWKAEIAYEYINNNIDLVSGADAIMCGNDSLAGEAIRALSENRLAGKIPVVGQDADLEACQRIVEGTQLMTVYKPVERLAKTAAEYAVKLAAGEDIGETDIFNDGSYDIPYVKLDPIAVNKKNIDTTIIETGFHLREEVYLNERGQ